MNELFPKIVEDFYARLERHGADNKYYVAGGACRDYLLGKEIRDIDIYMLKKSPAFQAYANLLRWVMILYPDHNVEIKGGGDYYDSGFVVFSIDTEIPIDFIVVDGNKQITEVVDGFTCHLSQVYMERKDGEISFVYSESFESDIMSNTITFVDSHVSNTGTYMTKLLPKYPERHVIRMQGDIFI